MPVCGFLHLFGDLGVNIVGTKSEKIYIQQKILLNSLKLGVVHTITIPYNLQPWKKHFLFNIFLGSMTARGSVPVMVKVKSSLSLKVFISNKNVIQLITDYKVKANK